MSPTTNAPSARRWGTVFLVAVGAYYVIQVLFRVYYAAALGLDEAELMVTTQAMAAGYGAQPPLYSWLQRLLFDLIGPGVPALAILKHGLLYLAFVFSFGVARLVLDDDDRLAVSATLGLFFLPQLAWESLGSLTHTVIAVTAGAATAFVFLRLLRDGRLWAYLAFGLCIALGVLSKYNFLILLVALVVAAATVRQFRPRLGDPRILLSLAVAAVLLAPHFIWVADHVGMAESRMHKFEMATDDPLVLAWGEGLYVALKAAVNYAGIGLVLILAVAFLPGAARRRIGEPAVPSPMSAALLRVAVRTLWIAALIIVVFILAARSRHLPDRWLHPVFFLFPVILVALFRQRIGATGGRLLSGIATAVAVACGLGILVFHLFPAPFGHAPHENTPFEAVAERIDALGLDRSYVLASDTYVAGNLKLRFPESTVAESEYGLWPTADGSEPERYLLAWTGDRDAHFGDAVATIAEQCQAAGKPVPSAADLDVQEIAASYDRLPDTDFRLKVASIPVCGSVPTRR
jgi:4-amino-4-deoxy-L-arabinose transferase-like glycosyltransferase